MLASEADALTGASNGGMMEGASFGSLAASKLTRFRVSFAALPTLPTPVPSDRRTLFRRFQFFESEGKNDRCVSVSA